MLELTRGVYDEIIAHARERDPEECCGVLGGAREGDWKEPSERASGRAAPASHADRYRRAANVAEAPRTAYELDPEEQLAHMQAIEDAGREVVGFVHSHPAGPPAPSRTDERQATWAGYSYVIVALGGAEPFVGSWRWTGEGFEQEVVAVQMADSPT
ncbi:desampylase [Halorientalis pallida]|uniref:desampylase n=1 Tax=Halorientalis pallida TaxID=2479928 RepID=UPI003C6EEC34